MPELKSEYLFTITLSVDALHDVGRLPLGTLHIDMLGKGTFEGPRLKGEVLPGGMDMKTLRADGAMKPNVRIVLKTDDGALIFMHYTGVRHGSPEVMARIARGEVVPPTRVLSAQHSVFRDGCAEIRLAQSHRGGRRRPATADHAAYDVFQIL